MFKFIVVGNTSVGKSCLLLQFTDQRYKETLDPTIGVDFGSSTVVIEHQPVKVQVWDTAGQEDFRSVG
jgi:small GTP-binding protein